MNDSITIKTRNYSGRVIAWTTFFSIAYAVLRYHIFGPVPWDEFPFFIMNKGIALSAYILLAFNFTLGPLKNLGLKVSDGWLNARKTLGMTGFLFALIHSLMSFLVFNSDIYGKFFEPNGSLTLMSGLSMFAGVLSLVILWVINLSFQTYLSEKKSFIKLITSRRFLLAAMLLGAAHLFFMGYKGWINPGEWHGGLPPISLVAFAFFAVGYIINLIGRK